MTYDWSCLHIATIGVHNSPHHPKRVVPTGAGLNSFCLERMVLIRLAKWDGGRSGGEKCSRTKGRRRGAPYTGSGRRMRLPPIAISIRSVRRVYSHSANAMQIPNHHCMTLSANSCFAHINTVIAPYGHAFPSPLSISMCNQAARIEGKYRAPKIVEDNLLSMLRE